jgi:hypothetical protein
MELISLISENNGYGKNSYLSMRKSSAYSSRLMLVCLSKALAVQADLVSQPFTSGAPFLAE